MCQPARLSSAGLCVNMTCSQQHEAETAGGTATPVRAQRVAAFVQFSRRHTLSVRSGSTRAAALSSDSTSQHVLNTCCSSSTRTAALCTDKSCSGARHEPNYTQTLSTKPVPLGPRGPRHAGVAHRQHATKAHRNTLPQSMQPLQPGAQRSQLGVGCTHKARQTVTPSNQVLAGAAAHTLAVSSARASSGSKPQPDSEAWASHPAQAGTQLLLVWRTPAQTDKC